MNRNHGFILPGLCYSLLLLCARLANAVLAATHLALSVVRRLRVDEHRYHLLSNGPMLVRSSSNINAFVMLQISGVP
jgi:hypothetical protein